MYVPNCAKGVVDIIDWISSWASAVIVAVIIGTIIEIILPEGNSKKYIKVVIGIYVLFTIISPVITKFTGSSIEVSNILNLTEYVEEAKDASKIQNTIQDDNENNIMNIYSEGIKNDIRTKLEIKGYNTTNIEVKIANDDSYNILSINVNVNKISINNQEENEDKNDNENLDKEIEKVESINKIQIDIGKNSNTDKSIEEDNKSGDYTLNNREKNELKEYLSNVYEIKEDKITIN